MTNRLKRFLATIKLKIQQLHALKNRTFIHSLAWEIGRRILREIVIPGSSALDLIDVCVQLIQPVDNWLSK